MFNGVVKNGIKCCFRYFGPTLLKDVYTFKAVLDSLIPDSSYQQECELIYQAVREVGYKLFEANGYNDEVRKYVYRELLQKMLDSKKFVKETAEPILQLLADSLKWNVPEFLRSQSLYMLYVLYANKRVGEHFAFGRYPQGANGEIKPIIWRVLRRDDNGILAISEFGLDCMHYNRGCESIWAGCTLRYWLNREFINEAFTEQEQSLIKTTEITNNAGPSTKDRIFLLSVDESRSLFADYHDSMCEPTNYAMKNHYHTGSWWWLRSRGHSDDCAEVVGAGNNVCYIVNVGYGFVRPALLLAV